MGKLKILSLELMSDQIVALTFIGQFDISSNLQQGNVTNNIMKIY